MADTDTAAAVQDEQFTYNVTVEDAGPATKKISVEIPEERIRSVLEKQYRDLKREAAIPGFRAGRAPMALLEKRFGASVKEEVRRQLISESYEQALEKNKLNPLGEPEFDNPDDIKLPESGALSYSFRIEVQPEFALPDMANCTVRRPKQEVTDAQLEQAMQNLRQQQGTLVPVEDRGIEDGDYIVADVQVKLGDEVVDQRNDAQLISRAGRIAGIQIEDLPERLRGARGGENRTFTAHAPESHADERVRDKDVQVEIAVKDIKRLELAELNQEFLESLGFANEQELRDALRQELENRARNEVQVSMRQQVEQFLLDNVQLELPAKLSDRQRERIIQRRQIELMLRGVPREQVEQNLEQIKAGADEEAQRELKLFFILQKVAADQEVDVDEAELNGHIAMLAVQRGRRPEKLKQEMAKDGSLADLYVRLREQKAIDELLGKVKIEDEEPKAE